MNATRRSSKASSSIIDFVRALICCALITASGLSCSSLDDRQKSLKKLGSDTFDPNLWATSNDHIRGRMIYDFLYINAPIKNKDRNFIIRNLGNSTGYFEYDINPAYYVGGAPQGGKDKAHLVVFVIDRESGRVSDILVRPEIE